MSTQDTDEFNLENTTVWSFPERGKWASHSGSYRGNWAPQVPRNLILRYSQKGDTVLDQMVGSGTTLVECALTGRNGLGVDINPMAIELTKNNLVFPEVKESNTIIKYQVGDAKKLDFIRDESIDLVVTHPPYLDIVSYSNGRIDEDLSNIHNIPSFCEEIGKVAKESFRVLKPGRFCAILIGDTRRKQHYIPLAYKVMTEFLKVGFLLKEDIVKIQWNCRDTNRWKKTSQDYNFLLIMHEHLFVFRKPNKLENLVVFKDSSLV